MHLIITQEKYLIWGYDFFYIYERESKSLKWI